MSNSELPSATPVAAESCPLMAPDHATPAARNASHSTDGVDGEWREIQLRYKLAPSSFKNLLTIPKAPSRKDVLRQACFCTEFLAFPLQPADKAFFRHVNDHTNIPYQLTEAVSQPWHKVFLLVQIDLSRLGWPNKISAAGRKELHSERGRIYRILDQVLRCVVDILGHKQDGRGVAVALDVLRSVKAGVWEGNDTELLQVEGIGQAKSQKLGQAGVKTVRQLAKLEFYHIERLLSRNPPFGQQVLHHLAGFPLLELTVQTVQPSPGSGVAPEQLSLAGQCILRLTLRYQNMELPIWNKRTPWTTLIIEGGDGRLLWFWRGSVKRLKDRKELLVRVDARQHETLQMTFACEEIVGTLQRETLRMP